jgi:hypothetical protein
VPATHVAAQLIGLHKMIRGDVGTIPGLERVVGEVLTALDIDGAPKAAISAARRQWPKPRKKHGFNRFSDRIYSSQILSEPE